MEYKSGQIVTRVNALNASNTYFVDRDEGDTVLLTHPLAKGLMIRVSKQELNIVGSQLKDSIERCIDYANIRRDMLDYNTNQDLDTLCMSFFIKRQLTPRQKQTLAAICGILATIKFNNNISEAMDYVAQNSNVLDEFNLMWYNNFKALFTKKIPVTSKKQRGAIFNIAGYVLAELESPSTRK